MSSGRSVTVWAASSGAYSNYEVICVFEKRDDAEAYVADGGAERVEELQMWPAGSRPERITYWYADWNPHHGLSIGDRREDANDNLRGLTRPRLTVNERWIADARTNARGTHWLPWVTGRCLDRQALEKAMKDRVAALRVREGTE